MQVNTAKVEMRRIFVIAKCRKCLVGHHAEFCDYKDSPHLDLCGIHLHVGSQNPDPVVFTQAFELLYVCLKHIYEETGTKLKHINIGGGFPVNYLRDRSIE